MNLQEKIIKYQTENTPRADYLAHYYWSNKWWSAFGSVICLLAILGLKLFFVVNVYCLPLALLPTLTSYLAGASKEKRDATGLGNEDKEDIAYTVRPSYTHVFFLLIIIGLICVFLY